MSTIHSVQTLANLYADQKLAHQNIGEAERVLFRKRIVYDFIVTGFNASTVASVTAVALALLVHSPLVFFLALMICGVRQAFRNEADLTALPVANREFIRNHLIERVANLTPQARRNEIAAYLGIDDRNWNPVHFQLLNFRAWMNWTTSARRVAAVEGELVNALPNL